MHQGETGTITVKEIRGSIRKSENNRTPVPNGILVELIKLLDEEGLELIRDVFYKEIMLDEMELAQLVTLNKKGNVEDPANYRPISLLNTIYKLYAAILQKRLAAGLDEKIWETQCGFRNFGRKGALHKRFSSPAGFKTWQKPPETTCS